MKTKLIAALCAFVLVACTPPGPSIPTSVVSPTFLPFPVASATSTIIPIETATFAPVGVTPSPVVTYAPTGNSSTYCSDPQVIAVIDDLKNSMLTGNGSLLASLVNPNTGMDVRFFRTGNVLTYSQSQAKFLFETTYQANWGAHPASGETVIGAFHEVVVPELVKSFKQTYTLYCNDLRHGGATYEPNWGYKRNFYVIHFPGTEQYGFLDWHSWVIGVDHVNGRPYIYAMTQFFWEP